MKLFQNRLKTLFFLLFLPLGNRLLSSSHWQTPEEFKQIILANDGKPFSIIRARLMQAVFGEGGTMYVESGLNIPPIDVTSKVQTYANKGLFTIPNDYYRFFSCSRDRGQKGLMVTYRIGENQNEYTITILESEKQQYLIEPQNGKILIARVKADINKIK